MNIQYISSKRTLFIGCIVFLLSSVLLAGSFAPASADDYDIPDYVREWEDDSTEVYVIDLSKGELLSPTTYTNTRIYTCAKTYNTKHSKTRNTSSCYRRNKRHINTT